MRVQLSKLAWVKAARVGMAAFAIGAFTVTANPGSVAAAPATVTFNGGDRVEVSNTDNAGLRVRSGPGLGYTHQATMEEGAVVRVVDGPTWSNGYGWYKVTGYDAAGTTGWSAGAFLYRVGGDSAWQQVQAPSSARRAAPAQQAAPARQEAAPAAQPRATGRTYQMLATGYNGAEFNSNGIMRNGNRVHWGAVAVDPTVIPLGTRMYIQGFGDMVFVAEDTGSAIKGNRIDIWFPTLQDALNFGGQTRTVTLIP